MSHLIGFFILSFVKILSSLLYRAEFKWLTPKPNNPWEQARLIVFMNHTSLFEPLFVQAMPFRYLWRLTPRMSVPGADVTLDRPIVGRFWKLMVPNISSVTRKKDASWGQYLETIKEDSIIMIAPEGRMKRPNGLDKFGKTMTVRGGVADIISNLDSGGMILCLSGGLHHVQAPGQFFPRFFKTIKMNFVYYDISEYKNRFSTNPHERKIKIVQDLQSHLENSCPKD